MIVARDSFLAAMRRVANSVAVVTTDGPAGRHGATVSAFCAVSADPPQVLVCLRADSRIAQLVRGNGAFCVNVLSETDAALAERFAGRGMHAGSDRFAGIELVAAAGDLPVLSGAASAFRCRLLAAIDAASHVIALGAVNAVHAGREPPLTYLDGRYGSVAASAVPIRTRSTTDADHPR